MNAKGLEKKSNFELLEYFFLIIFFNISSHICGSDFGEQQPQLF